MLRKKISYLSAAVAVVTANRAMAQFTGFQSPNDLVIVEVTANATPQGEDAVALQEFTPSGTLVGNPLNLPTASGSALTLPDASDHDGQLQLSTNKKFLLLGTYLSDIGNSAANADLAEQSPRVISDIYATGAMNSTTQPSDINDYDTVSMRSVISIDGREFWTSGNNGKPYSNPPFGDVGGLRYSTLGATTSTGMNNGLGFDNRTVVISNGQLYVDGGSNNGPAGTHTIYQAGTGLPTTSPTFTPLQLSIGGDAPGNQSPNFDQLASGATVLYQTNSTANSLDKLVKDGNTWDFEGRIDLPSGPGMDTQIEDVTSSVVGNTVTLYATSDHQVFSLTDTGGAGGFSSSTFTTILSAAPGQQFRGISFAPLRTINSIWGLATGDNWLITADWSNGVPWNAGDTATFSGNLSSSGSVALNSNVTIGHIVFDNPTASYNISTGSPGGTLTLDNTGGIGVADITVATGSHSITAPVSLVNGMTVNSSTGTSLTISGAISGSGSLTKSGAGTLSLTSANNYSGGTTVTGGLLKIAATGVTTSPLPHGPVTITGGQLQLATNATAGSQSSPTPASNINITSLSITGNGTLDLSNNHIIINYAGGPDPIASIASWIASGYANGSWTGPGIMSSAAQANSASYGIGYADAADPGNPAGLASGQIEIQYTLLGDANLDGKVNGTDFAILATNFNQAVGGWDAGDFNYDKKANGSDFAFIAGNFNQGASQAAGDLAALNAFASANGLVTSVPEPASAGLLMMIAGGALLSRRRSKNHTKCPPMFGWI